MYLIYFDESGNSGTNLADPQQPVFVLGALIVPETAWQAVEADLESCRNQHLPPPRARGFEVHAGDLRQGTGDFKGVSVAGRLTIRDEWLRLAGKHGRRFIYRAITKSRYERWMKSTFGQNIRVNPHLAAFPLVAQVANNYLRNLSKDALGIIISDDNREVVDDIERFLKLLRAASGALRLDRIIEKGFFIYSKKSLLIQLADLCTLHARKDEERKIGLPRKPIDDVGIDVPSNVRHDNTLARPLRDWGPKERVDVIVTNPPFGGMEEDGIESNYPAEFRTRETADLFLVLLMKILKPGGRAGLVLPDGTLFGEGVKTRIKEALLTECNLHTIVRLPNGVFNPYTGIRTNLLFFTKGAPTTAVWYYEHPYPAGAKSYNKGKPIRIEEFDEEKQWWGTEADGFADRVENERAWRVPIAQIKAGNFNLDLKKPHNPDTGPGDVDHLLPEYEKLLAQIAETRGQLKAQLMEALTR